MSRQHASHLLHACIAALLLAPSVSHAYVDPNAGGQLFQLLTPLLTAVIACWIFLRRWLANLLHKIRRRLGGSSE